MISHKAFVVTDIPEPQNTGIQRIRDQLGTITARLPVEITVAGSSGVGPIPEGTDLELIRAEVESIAAVTPAFVVEFAGVSHFPDTGVFFTPPKDRGPFDSLHASFVRSRIPFTASPFPYRPHCTLRVGPKVEPEVAERIRSLPLPGGEMRLDTISVYAVDARAFTVNLIHRAKLRG